MEALAKWVTLQRIQPQQEVLPQLREHAAPGHTPGHLIFVLEGQDRDIIFTGDAAKNRAELLSLTADMSLSVGDSAGTFDHIWSLWRHKPGNVLVPGHDLPMVLDADMPRYLGERDGTITAWLGDTLEKTTEINLYVT